MLAAGFTTIRDVGNAGNYADTALREAIERGLVARPDDAERRPHHRSLRRAISFATGEKRSGQAGYAVADTHDEMLKAIRENIHYGATVIKIVVDDQKYIYSV